MANGSEGGARWGGLGERKVGGKMGGMGVRVAGKGRGGAREMGCVLLDAVRWVWDGWWRWCWWWWCWVRIEIPDGEDDG